MAGNPPTTLAEQVYLALRTDLLRGLLEPGSKLKLGDFSARYSVSLSVVREAMARLAAQGLVQSSPQRGFWVTPLSIEDLRDLTRARVLIETLALRESIAGGALSWESTVLANHHTLDNTPMVTADGHVNPQWEAAHRDFHHALLSGCGSMRLESVAAELRDCAELYRFWSRELAHDTDRDVASEHRRITELTLARDAEGAAAALAAHIERTTAVLADYVRRRATA